MKINPFIQMNPRIKPQVRCSPALFLALALAAAPALTLKAEGDWATLDAGYVVNKHLTLAVGYGHFGNVLNHQANAVWGVTTKWEF
jgi:hypothetical protein